MLVFSYLQTQSAQPSSVGCSGVSGEGESAGSGGEFVDGCESFEGFLGAKYLLDGILGMKLPLQLVPPAPLFDEFVLLLQVGSVEDL
jgi:hypothetical protein